MLTGNDLIVSLKSMGLDFTVECHTAVFTMADSAELQLTLNGERCKNLLLKDRKNQLFLFVSPGNKPVDLQVLRSSLGSTRLSMASAEQLAEALGDQPGALSPLALVNDTDERVRLIMDSELKSVENYIFHPADNAISVQIERGAFEQFVTVNERFIVWVQL